MDYITSLLVGITLLMFILSILSKNRFVCMFIICLVDVIGGIIVSPTNSMGIVLIAVGIICGIIYLLNYSFGWLNRWSK